MAPDPARAYFWLQWIRGQPVFYPGTFCPNPMRFFWPEGKNLGFLGEIFLTWTTDVWPDLTRPDPSNKNWPDLTQVKNFWLGPIYSFQRYEFNIITCLEKD